MSASPHWTKRATTRLREAVRYIAVNFYPEYAIAFRNDAIDTANGLVAFPDSGIVAFPQINRANYRKILCRNRNWWIFYRVLKNKIEIASVKHVLQQADSPLDL